MLLPASSQTDVKLGESSVPIQPNIRLTKPFPGLSPSGNAWAAEAETRTRSRAMAIERTFRDITVLLLTSHFRGHRGNGGRSFREWHFCPQSVPPSEI
jgi:hypothetical protein